MLQIWWETFIQGIISALPGLGIRFGFIIFKLIVAIIVFVVGWFIALFVGKIVSEILIRVKLNQAFERTGWKTSLEKAEIKVNPSEFIGAIVKWILVIVVLWLIVDGLGLAGFAAFLESILAYLPNVIVAVLILVVAVILIDIVEKIVRSAVESIKVGYGHLVSTIVKWSIWIFAILAILQQLRFEPADWILRLVNIVFIGIVAMLAIAFGLGGKDVAAEILQDLKKKLKG